MKKDVLVFIKHIRDAIETINRFVNGVSQKTFQADKEKQYAVMRAIEIIGEAAKNISPEFRKKYADIPWKEMVGMRDKLIHQYFGVNLERVWLVVKNNLPLLKKRIDEILKAEPRTRTSEPGEQ